MVKKANEFNTSIRPATFLSIAKACILERNASFAKEQMHSNGIPENLKRPRNTNMRQPMLYNTTEV